MATPISADKLIDELQSVIREAENLLKATASQAGEKLDEARKRAERSVEQAKQRLADIEDEALERARAIADQADTYVHDKPWHAVAIAAGAGLVLGLLIGRR